jgi:outer membrane protein assembly factor BamB
LGGEVPKWGYTESPLLYQDQVLCTPGGEQGAIAALNKFNGELIWQTKQLTETAHYASMILAKHNDKIQCIQLLPTHVTGVDVESGQVRWQVDWPGRIAVIPTPIYHDDHVFVTSGYGVGGMLLRLGEDDAEGTPGTAVEEVYRNKIIKNHHGGAILIDGHLYGHSDKAGWICQNFSTGEVVWRERKALGKGAIAYADGHFYCLGEQDGDVALIEASPEGWKEHGHFTLDPQTTQRSDRGKIWTHPVICNGKLYLRDQELLFCFDVKEERGG